MSNWGNKSQRVLNHLHPDLRTILNSYIAIAKIDISLVEGVRLPKRQKEMFDRGLSKIDGYKKKGKHQPDKNGVSHAVDFCIFTNQKNYRNAIRYDENHLSYVAGAIDALAIYLYKMGVIKHKIRWGGNWDGDGVIKKDQRFQDLCHIELID
ncbi:MAG: M15 family metallopeptidase [Colwellia sp.]|nr:M15 family metallopeptidase [Colwellia sp.]